MKAGGMITPGVIPANKGTNPANKGTNLEKRPSHAVGNARAQFRCRVVTPSTAFAFDLTQDLTISV